MHGLKRLPIILLCLVLACVGRARAVSWYPYGPNGGDARSFAADPHDPQHLYLGTEVGWIYESKDGGRVWKRLARVGKRDDLVIDSIVVDAADSKHILVGAWVLDRPDGGLYVTSDGGTTWQSQSDLQGQSILALAQAPSDPKVLVAGTLQAVYRTEDSGAHWAIISPAGSKELHEVESIAIDPQDVKIIYAGTWHLPWRTTDGGATWNNIKEGIIDDSDVFSIIVDPKTPTVVYASACSGIYKSEDKGEKFVKVQGIPSTARRTRVLMQDPGQPGVVYAGTTEGLFRTEDAGQTWRRTTSANVIVNDIYVDPSNTKRVLLATDRGGVLASEDSGDTFVDANKGFSARQVIALITDTQQPATLYAGVVNDKTAGGVFVSQDGGMSWTQRSDGLEGRDVFALVRGPEGVVVAGTEHGFLRFEEGMWHVTGTLPVEGQDASGAQNGHVTARGAASVGREIKPPTKRQSRRGMTVKPRGAKARRTKAAVTPRSRQGKVRRGGRKQGAGRRPVPKRATPRTTEASGRNRVVAPQNVAAVPSAGPRTFDGMVYGFSNVGESLFAVTARGLMMSGDGAKSWTDVSALPGVEWRFIAAAGSNLVVATLRSLTLSKDGGATWEKVAVPETLTQIGAVAVDGTGGLWLGGRQGVFYSSDRGATWETLKNLYVTSVNSIFYDEPGQRVLVTSSGSPIVFSAALKDKTVSYVDTGWNLRSVRPLGDHLVGITMFDGVVLQPRMVESK